MGRSEVPPLRSLPRTFLLELEPEDFEGPFEIPREEFRKIHDVLRLRSGAQIAILPGDGRLIRCVLEGRTAVPQEVHFPETEAKRLVTLALGLPKPEKLEESIRLATELGVSHFILFPADRSVVKWDAAKWELKLKRLQSIAREACEVSFRTKVPSFESLTGLADLLQRFPQAVVFSEGDQVTAKGISGESPVLVVGPEGGWAPREVALIGDRAVTLGPRVFRVDTAVAAACALTLLVD
ncbi:MAG: 16S rRNA (uracil(1498)-N(3))-methyltransferase [Fimbriimonadaceae bacterium]|nr:16S rRNA (uracil(1498)-N(3))-methyltransferase [Fimbriimonadaceae bacterium]